MHLKQTKFHMSRYYKPKLRNFFFFWDLEVKGFSKLKHYISDANQLLICIKLFLEFFIAIKKIIKVLIISFLMGY